MKFSCFRLVTLVGTHMLLYFEPGAFAFPEGITGVPEMFSSPDGGMIDYSEVPEMFSSPGGEMVDPTKEPGEKGDLIGDLLNNLQKPGGPLGDVLGVLNNEGGSMNMKDNGGGSMDMEDDEGDEMDMESDNCGGSNVNNGAKGLFIKLFVGNSDATDFETEKCGCSKGKGHSNGSGMGHGGHDEGRMDNKGGGNGKQDDKFSSGKYAGIGDEYTGNSPIHDAPSGSLRRFLQEVNSRLATVHHLQNKIGSYAPGVYDKVNPQLSEAHKNIYQGVNNALKPSDFVKGFPTGP